ncbi:uncharacterized protein LOC135934659 [Cloeon dipterum]|uniref:uncharacterized protein LOC135934659 n=1 Tax=Cloeon dipterum TaxID=197152 RepID=UPI00321FF18F
MPGRKKPSFEFYGNLIERDWKEKIVKSFDDVSSRSYLWTLVLKKKKGQRRPAIELNVLQASVTNKTTKLHRFLETVGLRCGNCALENQPSEEDSELDEDEELSDENETAPQEEPDLQLPEELKEMYAQLKLCIPRIATKNSQPLGYVFGMPNAGFLVNLQKFSETCVVDAVEVIFRQAISLGVHPNFLSDKWSIQPEMTLLEGLCSRNKFLNWLGNQYPSEFNENSMRCSVSEFLQCINFKSSRTIGTCPTCKDIVQKTHTEPIMKNNTDCSDLMQLQQHLAEEVWITCQKCKVNFAGAQELESFIAVENTLKLSKGKYIRKQRKVSIDEPQSTKSFHYKGKLYKLMAMAHNSLRGHVTAVVYIEDGEENALEFDDLKFKSSLVPRKEINPDFFFYVSSAE